MGTATFSRKDWEEVAAVAKQQGKPFMLVKDEGIYIMCHRRDGKPMVRYSMTQGCDPTKPSYSWDKGQEIAGGDDFAEKLDAHEMEKTASDAKAAKSRLIYVDFKPETLEIWY